MKIVLYGAGGYLSDRIEQVENLPDTEIVGITDTSESVHGKKILGHIVVPFSKVYAAYDYIVITSSHASCIEDELISQNVQRVKIKRLKEYMSIVGGGFYKRKVLMHNSTLNIHSVAAITPILEYNGACLAIIYMLEELHKNHGYKTMIVSSQYKDEIVDYIYEKGIDILVDPQIEFNGDKVLYKIAVNYDYVIVNTLLMRKCLNYLNPLNTIWWIHESLAFYCEEQCLWNDFSEERYSLFHTFCVSSIGQKVFSTFFPGISSDILEYGIPDTYSQLEKKYQGKIIFAVIGFINEIKGQDILIKAFDNMGERYKSKCELWCIGEFKDDDIEKLIQERTAEVNSNIVIKGALPHGTLEEIYNEIDVIVAPSREDTVSIAITEGLMNKKMCVVSDAAGISNYLNNSENAFIFKSEDVDALTEILCYIIDNFSSLYNVAELGRKIYEDNFLIDKVGRRIEKIFKSLSKNEKGDC